MQPDLEPDLLPIDVMLSCDLHQPHSQQDHGLVVAVGVRPGLLLLVEGRRCPGAGDDVPVAHVLILVHAKLFDRIVELLEELVEQLERLRGRSGPEQLLGLQ
eukprot:767873-Hanusia_phi.AAC.2